jgi:hypothetical protein
MFEDKDAKYVDFSKTINYRKKLFPISYYKDKIENNQKIKDEIVPIILENSKVLKENPPKGWLTNNIMTSFYGEPKDNEIFFGDNSYFQEILENNYSKCFDNFFDDYYEISVDKMWYNCYVNGEYQESHDHLGSFFSPSTFSCVHFLSFDKTRHKPLCFYDPLSQIRGSTTIEFGSHNYKNPVFLDIEEGDLIMFPSFLQHSVYPSPPTPDYPRITIAFNIVVTKYGKNQIKY